MSVEWKSGMYCEQEGDIYSHQPMLLNKWSGRRDYNWED